MHRNSRYFGRHLVLAVRGERSVFSTIQTAENYWKQVVQTFSSESEEGGRGYAGEVLLELLLQISQNDDVTLADIIACEDLTALKNFLNLNQSL